MINDGADPEKVWITGNLRVASANKPNCVVNWGWHVAPTLQVATATAIETWVIDPSLFPGPVTRATWAGVQGDPNAVLLPSPAVVFYYWGGVLDPTFLLTNRDLQDYRNLLLLRSAEPAGPPPYTNCMVRPPNLQWYGSVGPNQSHIWFTWGWNAATKVLWTIMPLTKCPGRPQLSWDVRVERANATQCTYWITVTNLTSDTVKFEGRYDVLAG